MRNSANKKSKPNKMKTLSKKMPEKEKDYIERELISIKNEIGALKISLTKKADIDFLKELEKRVIKIEKRLKIAGA